MSLSMRGQVTLLRIGQGSKGISGVDSDSSTFEYNETVCKSS